MSRVVRAVLGWVPVALAIGWVGGGSTGCDRASATCDPADATLIWLAQVAVLIVLLMLPRLASVAALGAIAALVVAVPVALVVSAPGGADGGGPPTAMLVAAVLAWLAGAAVAVVRAVERGARPVS